MKAIGTVVFIGVLLLIAGIESNPGPTTLGSCTCSSRPTKIKVTGLPVNIDEEDLHNLFENKRRQGGGDVRQVQVFKSQRTAIIEFEESEAVEIVLKKRPISIKKTEVSAYIFHSSNTVEVTNIPTDVSVESLKKYFEEQASDEYSITCIVREADVAFVTFKNEQITKQILCKDRHTLENHQQPMVLNFHDPELVHADQINVTSSSDLNIGFPKINTMPDNPEETAYYLRLVSMFMDLCTESVRKVFNFYSPNNNGEDFIRLNQAKLNELKTKGILNQQECEVVITQWPNLRLMDISLLITLSINLFTTVQLPTPTKGWDRPPKGKDISIAADLLRLRKIRNVIVGHHPCARLPQWKFEKEWKNIETILLRIERQIDPGNEVHLQSQIECYLIQKLQPCIQNEHDSKLKEWHQEVSKAQKQVDEYLKNLEGFNVYLKDKSDRYERYIKLLVKGGRFVLSALIRTKCQQSNLRCKLDEKEDIIREKITDSEHLEILYRSASDRLDLSVWDISLLAGVLLYAFESQCDLKEAIENLYNARKNYAEVAVKSLDPDTFVDYLSDLKYSINVAKNYLNSEEKSHINEILEESKKKAKEDGSFKNYLEELKSKGFQMKTFSDIHKETVQKTKETLQQMITDGISFDSNRVIELKMITVGSDEEKKKIAENILFEVWQTALDRTENNGNYQEIQEEVNKILIEIKKSKNIQNISVEQKCVLLQIESREPCDMLALTEYFESDLFHKSQDDICKAVGYHCDTIVAICSNVTIESLHGILNEQPLPKQQESGIRVPITVSSPAAMMELWKLFRSEQFSNSTNAIADKLSKHSNTPITLETFTDMNEFNDVFDGETEQSSTDSESNDSLTQESSRTLDTELDFAYKGDMAGHPANQSSQYDKQKRQSDIESKVTKLEAIPDHHQKHLDYVKQKKDHGLQTFDEKKLYFRSLLERMDISSRVENPITVTEVLSVHIVSTETQEVDERDYPWTFLQKLCTGNYKARDMCFALSERDQSSNTLSPLDDLDKESEERISPLDLFLAIYSCCDPMLKQLIFKNLYLCQLAVPFIADQLCSSDQCPSVSIWPLRALLIESKIAQDGSTESEVLDLRSARVTFARFGRPAFSKSKVLNFLLNQDAYNTFYNFWCTYGTAKRKVSNGYVEMFWLPMVKDEKGNLRSPLTFFNVRGDLQMYFCEQVLPFLSQITDIFVLVIEIKYLLHSFTEVQNIIKNYRYVLLIICGPLDPKDVHKVNSLKECEASLKEKNPNSTIHIVLTHNYGIEKNMLQVANVISEKIETFQKDIVKTTLKDRLSNIENKNVKIDETEQACVEGKRIATDIIEAMGTENDAPLLWKKRVTPAHSLYSRRLGETNMKIRREQDTTRIEQLRHEVDNLRKEQIRNITPAIKLFARYLVSKAESPSCLRFILAWLNIFIQVEKQKLLPQLIKENRTAWTKMGDIKSKSNPNSEDIAIQRESIKRTENQIQEASFSIELLFHEIGHIYDAIIILRKDSTSLELPSINTMLDVCASLFVEGNTLELIDGEAFHMPQHWIGKVFEKVSELMGSPKVLTISILGIQSSGKSTLLNTMFGSQFPTSVGRCTKGIQMKLLPLRIDNLFQYILVLDTEGLRAPDVTDEKCDFDNQMATIITGLGDITVMNVMGENAMAIRDILQVVVHAFLRLKLADPNIDLRKRCTFIYHNVSSVMALDKMRPSVSKLMEILDSVTKDAAEMEGISDVVEFNQIIQFDMTSQVWFLPNLLEGCPPRIKCEYSSQAADIKSKLLQLAISDTGKSYGSLNDVIMHARDLWKGVLTEDFVFYFRNSEEIRAYNMLESKILHWLSELQCFCRKKCLETSQEVFQKCSEQQELEGATEAANKLILDDLHKKEIEVKQEIDKCFNENEFKNAICRWKDETTARFEYTCMDLRNSIKKETERFRQKRSIEIFQNSNRAEHEDKLHKKSVKLAKDAKDLSVEEINKQFENIWQEFVKEIENKSHVPTSCIFKKRLHEMYTNDTSLHGLIDEQTLQFNTPDLTSNNLSDLLSEKLNFLLKDVLQVTKVLTNIEKKIQSYITRPYSIKDENISLFLEEVEKEIKYKSTWKNESLKMKTKAEILVIICCYSSRLFDKHNLDPRTHQSEPLSEKHVHNYLYKLFATERAIVCQMINQKPPFASLKLSNIDGYADDISIPRHFFTVSKILVSDKKKISLVLPHVDKILSKTGFQIDELCHTDTELSEFNIKTVLYNVKKAIENLKTYKNEFTLTNRFTIRICVHVGEYAYSKFQKHNEFYQEKIARRLTNYKQSVRAQFDAYLSDRKQEDTAALLISSEIETIAREAIRLCMPSKVLHELLNTIPSTKFDLIIDMLTDMAEGGKFFPFAVYIESPSEYAETWITEQSKNYLFAENPTGYFKIASRSISKIFEDIYNAIYATSVFFRHYPPTLERWMEQLNKNLKHCRIRDENIRNAKREIMIIQNVTNFNRILLDNLKESENKLTSEAENETEDTVLWGSLNPYKEVFKMYWGCEEQCRYCGEPCFKSKHDEKSSKHKCLQHRPGCCSGIQNRASKTAMLETCNFNVQKSGKVHNCLAFNFACNRLEGKPCDESTMHLFSDYRKYLPDWDIEPDMDMSESSGFWMWFVATYKQQLADYYGYDVSNIPASWLCISKESALQSLRRKYD